MLSSLILLVVLILGNGGVSRMVTQSVPGGAPSGSYEYFAHVGTYPEVIMGEGSFTFEKLSAGNRSALEGSDWSLSGWEDDNSRIFSITTNLSAKF
jgi:hypothetical protein